MSFRRVKESGVTGSRWRVAHRGILIECGIPSEVVNSHRRWLCVLLHGLDYPSTSWDVTWISPEQAGRLLEILERELKSHLGYDLLRCLRQRAGTPLDQVQEG